MFIHWLVSCYIYEANKSNMDIVGKIRPCIWNACISPPGVFKYGFAMQKKLACDQEIVYFFCPFIIFGEWYNWAQTLKSHANSIKAGNATFIFVSVSDRGSFGKYSVLFHSTT